MRRLPQLMRWTLPLILLAFVQDRSDAQDDEDVQQLDTRISRFFQNLNDQQVDAATAFADLLAEGPLAGADDVKKLVERVPALEKTYGEFLASERVATKRVGKDLVLLKYLYKTERYPVVWYFTYYRPPSKTGEPNDWVVITVRFDTRVDLLGL